MGRPKKNSSQELVMIVDEFYETEGYGDPRRLKFSNLEAFAKGKGMTAKAYDFKRDESVRKRIEELSEMAELANESEQALGYRNLDIEGFLKKCRTTDDIIKYLAEVDEYWRSTYDYTQSLISRDQRFMKEKTSLERKIAALEKEGEQARSDMKSTVSELNSLKKENMYLRKMLRTYLYPNLANEILRQNSKGKVPVPENNAVNEDAFGKLIDGATPSAFDGVQGMAQKKLGWKEQLEADLERGIMADGK